MQNLPNPELPPPNSGWKEWTRWAVLVVLFLFGPTLGIGKQKVEVVPKENEDGSVTVQVIEK